MRWLGEIKDTTQLTMDELREATKETGLVGNSSSWISPRVV